jgi:heat shock protein HtpX
MPQRSNPSRLPETFVDPASGQRISLLDWKAANVRSSVLLALFMFALFAGIAYLLALAIDPGAAALFIGVALLIAGVQNLIAYWYSDKLALRATGAREATREEHRYLVNVTEAVALGAGVPPPKIYVIDSPAPNAFATGRNPENGAVAVTTGLMKLLDRQELEGVIAHEMAHIRNYDILFLSMLAATLGAILILRDVVMRSMFYGRGRRGGGGSRGGGQAIALLLLVVVLVLAPLLATLLKLAVSRRREYLADATAAYITRNPEGLARALEKLGSYKGEPLNVSEGVRHLFFVNPLARFNARALFATHPPIEERIARLRRM